MTKCITETLRMWPALANGTFRELEKGRMKYLNSYHQCSVMTRQEVDIEIVKMEKCIAVKDDMFVTTYKY